MKLVDFEDRLERVTESGCLIWTGETVPFGYGRIRRKVDGVWRQTMAHRLAWEERHGSIPEGMFICHRCDVAACVNVDHLFMGTHADNMADMVRKGRSPRRPGELNCGGVKLTEEKVLALRADGRPYRVLAVEYGVSVKTVGRIKRREKWKHLP